jgi:putative resolvase
MIDINNNLNISTIPKTNSKYVSGKVTKEILGVSDNTLRRWANENKINIIRNCEKGKRFYDINSIIESNITNCNASSENANSKRIYCYCRVSTPNQKDDLKRQISDMQSKIPNAIIIKDIGSGINWKRKGLLSLIQQVKNGKVEQIIISHKDRLCRFAYELLEYFFQLYQVSILVLDKSEKEQTPDAELAEDILSIIHVFSCKKMGQRRYASSKKE